MDRRYHWRGPRGLALRQTQLPSVIAAISMMMVLTSCSEELAGSETIREKDRQLLDVLPTASIHHTMRTKREVGVFRSLFFELCDPEDCESAERECV